MHIGVDRLFLWTRTKAYSTFEYVVRKMQRTKPYWQNYINGAWADGGAGRVDVLNPATAEKFAEQELADAADIDRAVHAARRVHVSGALSDLRPVERGRMVQAFVGVADQSAGRRSLI